MPLTAVELETQEAERAEKAAAKEQKDDEDVSDDGALSPPCVAANDIATHRLALPDDAVAWCLSTCVRLLQRGSSQCNGRQNIHPFIL